MTLRPIDLQVMVPKTVEVVKIQQEAKHSSEASQNLISTQLNHQQERAKHKVTERSKAEGVRINQEDSSKKNRQGSKKQKKKRKKNSSLSAKRGNFHSHIDIKI